MRPDPTILSFDTSAAHVAAAVLSGGRIVTNHHEDRARGQDAVLFPVLEVLLSQAHLGWDDLDAIAVGIGPGNFTGVRISVAAAKGLGLSLNIPVIGVNGFDALRYGQQGLGYAAIPAPRGAAYIDAGQGNEPTLCDGPDTALPIHQSKADPYLVGGVDTVWATALHAQPVQPKHSAAIAIAHVAAGRFGVAQDGTFPKPMYIKPADAAPPKNAAPVIVP